MDFVRALHRKKYKKGYMRFYSDSFKKPNPNAGISIIDVECIRAAGKTICEHIEHYYRSVTDGKPFAFWGLRRQDFEDCFGRGQFSIIPRESNTGDICHRDLGDVDNKASTKFLKTCYDTSDVYWCIEDECLPLNEDLDEILQEILPDSDD